MPSIIGKYKVDRKYLECYTKKNTESLMQIAETCKHYLKLVVKYFKEQLNGPKGKTLLESYCEK